jgi:hypothetical protein
MHTTEMRSDTENIIPFPSNISTTVTIEVEYHQIHLSETPSSEKGRKKGCPWTSSRYKPLAGEPFSAGTAPETPLLRLPFVGDVRPDSAYAAVLSPEHCVDPVSLFNPGVTEQGTGKLASAGVNSNTPAEGSPMGITPPG